MADLTDPAFSPLKDETFFIWRVEMLKLVPVPKEEWGKFFSGDCYLVFDNRDTKKVQEGVGDIYFWIGANSTIDEQAVVAIKAVELDDFMGGAPVQHREVMGHESSSFRKIFPEGIITLRGGVDSGLKEVDRTHQVKLFQVMGGKAPILREVDLDWSHVNHGDTFVLDAGEFIFIWSGSSSSGMEKMKAANLAQNLRDKAGERIVNVRDGQEEDLDKTELEVWCRHLPLEQRTLVTEAQQTDDSVVRNIIHQEISLYSCSDITGNLNIELIKQGNLQRNDLIADDSFIINAGDLGIWVWLGRKSNAQERKMAMETGLKFIKDNDLSPNTKLTKVFMNGEPEEFRCLFINW